MAFILKSILSDISIAHPLFYVHFLGIFFSILSLYCIYLLFCGGPLADSIYAGHVFLSTQLSYVFWLEYLMHLCLKLLLIGPYSLPFFFCIRVSLSLSLISCPYTSPCSICCSAGLVEMYCFSFFLLPVYKVFSSKRVDLEEWDYSILPKTRNSRYSFLCDAF